MTMLTHTRAAFGPTTHSPGRRDSARFGVAKARLAIVKRFFIGALMLLAAACALAAMMALDVAIYVPGVFHH